MFLPTERKRDFEKQKSSIEISMAHGVEYESLKGLDGEKQEHKPVSGKSKVVAKKRKS